MIRVRLLLMVIFCCLIFPTLAPISAQDKVTDSCVLDIQKVIQNTGTICASLGAGNLCYGNPGVSALSGIEIVESFAQAGDRISLENFTSVRTEGYDSSTRQLGVAIMNLQANLPVSYSENGAALFAVGDITVTNAVASEDALILPETALDITVGESGAELYAIPPGFDASAKPFGSVPKSTVLEADGTTVDGQWLRVFALHDEKYDQNAVAWINKNQVIPNSRTADLPTITADSLTPMQSFYVSTPVDEFACGDVPSSILYLQGPEEVQVDLRVNGADIRFGSTILLRLLPPGNRMQMIVLGGLGILYPNTPDEIVITPGFASEICLKDLTPGDDRNKRVIGGNCKWSTPSLLSDVELEVLYRLLDNRVPENLQHYRTHVPRLICPSGVGQPRCIIRLVFDRLIDRLRRLCVRGILPESVCELYSL